MISATFFLKLLEVTLPGLRLTNFSGCAPAQPEVMLAPGPAAAVEGSKKTIPRSKVPAHHVP